MYSHLISASVQGIDAYLIDIETHIESAMPAFSIVGLPDAAVKESRDRVTAAIKNSEFIFPAKRITINLAPADIRKEGSAFDLPIAIGILTALNIVDSEVIKNTLFIGELSLDGKLRPTSGILSIAMEASRQEVEKIILPKENASEAALAPNIKAIGVESLAQAFRYLSGEEYIEPAVVDVDKLFEHEDDFYPLDMADVKGQENVKRALEAAAAGGHNLLMIGPPGSGKTMLAKRISAILPPLSLEEALETTKIHSCAGVLESNVSLITMRPFRSPHHTISDAALVGGGMHKIRPGEISLSHHGVLFMDELPEFARNVIEVLRQPLEDHRITISRTKQTVDYPANFMLVCSMNPCPCGNFGDPAKECTCRQNQIKNYLSKISGPLLDRIDIHVEVPAVKYQELSSERRGEPSKTIRQRVINARKIQSERFNEIPDVYKNADMSSRQIREFCKLDKPSADLLKNAMTRLGLSARAYDRILKVSRTIADLEEAKDINIQHISEAIQYRSLDREYWR